MKNKAPLAHLLAVFTMLIWGVSFVATKLAVQYVSPDEVVFWRVIVAIIFLFAFHPRFFTWQGLETELLMALSSLTGITVYQMLENYAVAFSQPSNVSVIVSTAPFFTVIVARLFFRTEKIRPSFLIGFVVAITGICLFSFQGKDLHFGYLGDALALGAAFSWGFYQSIVRLLTQKRINQAAMTRRIFEYAALTLLPSQLVKADAQSLHNVFHTPALFYILFLGALCSALCFFIWNFSIKELGAVKSSVYIYLNPVFTLVASALILSERLHPLALLGVVLTFIGLFISNEDSKNALRSLFKLWK